MGNDPSWKQIESVFQKAVDMDADRRAEFVHAACGDDEELRRRVESLLAHDASVTAATPEWGPKAGYRIGPYDVISRLGAGGMGEVYLARDSRLDRQVALKILSPPLAGDQERRRRFLWEAKAASALNHPNIVTVYDVGTDGNLDYLVMEYVAGKPLDRLIPHDGLKLKEALKYAVQIADALAAAHSSGIVHRDVKPANVLITDSGTAKVVDFGLAKQVRQEQDAASLTKNGMIVGTVAYMSPEQAEGKPVDARSDIFSFGALLYEMLTGRRAFHRDTAAATLAAVLGEEPKLDTELVDGVPLKLGEILHRCLRKSPGDRFDTIKEVKSALDAVRENVENAVSRSAAGPRKHRNRSLWPVVGAAAVVTVVTAAVWYMDRGPAERVLTPVPLTTYPGFEGNASFSPDGMQVAFSWCEAEGTPSWLPEYANICNIYVKQIGVEPASRLTEGMVKDFSPAWSPDGQWIAFLRIVASKKLSLLVIPQRGGPERVLAEHDLAGFPDMPPGPYVAWTPDSQSLVYTTPGREAWFLSLVGVNSAENRMLTRSPRAGSFGDTAPSVSPDGKILAFSRYDRGYHLYKLRLSAGYVPQGEAARLPSAATPNLGAAWLPDGSELVFASNVGGIDGLWRTSVSGIARPHRLSFAPNFASEPAVSHRGNRLAYTVFRNDVNIWRVDLAGSDRKPGTPAPVVSSTRRDSGPACSPDGKKLAFVSDRSGAQEVWVSDVDGSNPRQLTSLGGWLDLPEWSPDGENIAATIFEDEQVTFGIINIKTRTFRRLPGEGKWPSWSPDGKWLYFATNHPTAIWKLHLDGGARTQLTSGPGDDMPQPSADGRFIYFNKGWPGKLSIWRIPVEGGNQTKIIDGVSTGGQWTVGPDGIYFFTTPDAKGRSEIRVYVFATRKVIRILTVDHTVGIRISISPDGRHIFYPQYDSQGSDLMLVENFQ